MKKSFILFAALAALFSCTKETPVSPETPSQETYSVTLTAVAPTAGDDTKTTLVEGGKFVHWSKGDAIKVMFFAHYDGSDPFRYTAFESQGQVLTSDFQGETADEALFRIDNWVSGTMNVTNSNHRNSFTGKGIAVYPSTATAWSKRNGEEAYAISSEVSYVLPEEQVAVENNIESDLNFSYARVDFDDFFNKNTMTELQFKNACSLIKLTMPQSFGEKNVVSINIESNDSKPLTGKGEVPLGKTSSIYSEDNKFPSTDDFSMTVSGKNGVTLVNESGFEAGATYYAVAWPGDHSGLTFTFNAEDGATATVTTSKAVSLLASHVKPYTFKSELKFEEEESWVYYAPGEGTGKYYYSNGTVGDNPAPTDRTILGVVFYNGNPRDGKDTALPAHCTHGLAIRTKVKSGVKWNNALLPNEDYRSYSKLVNVNEGWGYDVKNLWNDLYGDLTLYTTDYSLEVDGAAYDLPESKTSGWYHATGKEWGIIKDNKSVIEHDLSQCGGDPLPTSSTWLPVMYDRANRQEAWFILWSGSWYSCGESKNYIHYVSGANARPIFAF